MNEQQMQALAASANFDQLKAMVVTLGAAVAAAELYLDQPPQVSGGPSRVKAMTRAYVEEAMALLRPQA